MPLSSSQYQKTFINSEEASEVLKQLKYMEDSSLFATKPSYSHSNKGDISFSEKHFAYISVQPAIKPSEYLANLRLMTRLRK